MKRITAFAGFLLALVACDCVSLFGDGREMRVPVNNCVPMDFRQYDLLRTYPGAVAPFVPFLMPSNAPPPIKEELLSRQGAWEEWRLHYRFKYPISPAPGICGSALFDETLTGFRKPE